MIWSKVAFLTIYYTMYIKNVSFHNRYSVHFDARIAQAYCILLWYLSLGEGWDVNRDLLKHFSHIIFILLRLSLSI